MYKILNLPRMHQGPYRARIEQKLRQRALAHAKDAHLICIYVYIYTYTLINVHIYS